MSVSSLRVAKSETRQFGERDRHESLRFGEAPGWTSNNGAFFVAFVAIAAVLTVLALVLRA